MSRIINYPIWRLLPDIENNIWFKKWLRKKREQEMLSIRGWERTEGSWGKVMEEDVELIVFLLLSLSWTFGDRNVYKMHLILKVWNSNVKLQSFIPNAYSNCREVHWAARTFGLVNIGVWCSHLFASVFITKFVKLHYIYLTPPLTYKIWI